MDLVEFGGVCEVGVFRCVVVIPVGFSSEAEYWGWGGQLLFLVLRGRKQILRVKTVNLMENIDSSRVGFS